MMGTKKCNKCGVTKNVSEFSEIKRISKKGDIVIYLKGHCNTCQKEYDKKYQKNNSDKLKGHQRKYKDKNSDKIKEYDRTYRAQNAEKLNEYIKKYRNNRYED